MRRKGGKGEAARMKKTSETPKKKPHTMQSDRERKLDTVTLPKWARDKLARLAVIYGGKSAAIETLIDAADES